MPILQRICRWTGRIAANSSQRNRAPILERVFLHVGVEKTGTTTLQVALAMNRRLFRRYGYAIPATPRGFPSCHIGLALCAAHPDAVPELRQAARLTSSQAYDAFIKSYPEKISRELIGSGCHTAILSNEHCSSRLTTITEIGKIHQILARLARECRVIIYLRRQDEVVASHYSTAVRSGGTHEFNFSREIHWVDYLHLLEMWAQVFGKENITVRIFEPQQLKDGDLLTDFFSIVGFRRQDKLSRPDNQNRSLDVHTLEFMRRFNMHLPSGAEAGLDVARGSIDEALAAITTDECLQPSTESASSFLSRFATSNAEVARRFLNREDGMLFMSAPREDQPTRLPALDVDKAVAISVALWQWQEARLRASLRNDQFGGRRGGLPPIPLPFRKRFGPSRGSDD